MHLRRGVKQTAVPSTSGCALRSATVWSCQGGLWKRTKNGGAVFRLSHNPGCGCRHNLRIREKNGCVAVWCSGHVLADLSGFGVEPHEQLVGQGDADDFRGFSGGGEPLAEGDEVGLVAAHHAGHDEQDFAYRRSAFADAALVFDACRCREPCARPASLEMVLLDSVPISGISAIRRHTVRSATPLMERKAWSSSRHSGSASISVAMFCSRASIWAATTASSSANDASTAGSVIRRRWFSCAVRISVSCRRRGDQGAQVLAGRGHAQRRGLLDLGIPGDHAGVDGIGLFQPAHALGKPAHGARVEDGHRQSLFAEAGEGQPPGAAGGRRQASSTWWAWQKAASAAMPSELLANEVRAPWRPRRASREDEAISTPQMMRVTVTCPCMCDRSVMRLFGRARGLGQRSLG